MSYDFKNSRQSNEFFFYLCRFIDIFYLKPWQKNNINANTLNRSRV